MPGQRLGRIRPAIDPHKHPRFLQFGDYLGAAALKPAPNSTDWGSKIAHWFMHLNDQLGCCAVATIANYLQVATSSAGNTLIVPSDPQVLAAYSAISGYNPVTGANDNGCIMSDVYAYFQKIGVAGNKTVGSAAINPKNLNNLMWGCNLMGGLGIGVNLPESALEQNDQGKPWTYVPLSKNAGGHAIYVWKYDVIQRKTTPIIRWVCTTWAKPQEIDQSFMDHYLDEAWITVDACWIDSRTELAPSGLRTASLITDMFRLAA